MWGKVSVVQEMHTVCNTEHWGLTQKTKKEVVRHREKKNMTKSLAPSSMIMEIIDKKVQNFDRNLTNLTEWDVTVYQEAVGDLCVAKLQACQGRLSPNVYLGR